MVLIGLGLQVMQLRVSGIPMSHRRCVTPPSPLPLRWHFHPLKQSTAIMKPFRNKGWVYYDRMLAIMPSSQPRGTHAFHLALAASVTASINTDPNDVGSEQGPSSQPISQTYVDVSNALGEGSGEIINDRMSPDHDIEMPFSLPLSVSQFPSNSISATSLPFSNTPPLPPIITPSEILPPNLSLPASTHSGSIGSGNSKRKFSAVAGQDASVTSSKKKAAKRASRAATTATSNVTQAIAYHGFQGLIVSLMSSWTQLSLHSKIWHMLTGIEPLSRWMMNIWQRRRYGWLLFHEQFSCSRHISFIDGWGGPAWLASHYYWKINFITHTFLSCVLFFLYCFCFCFVLSI